MNHEKYRFFIAAGEPLKAIKAWQAENAERVKMQDAFRKEIRADALLFVYELDGTQRVVGAVFKKTPPAPWRHYKKDDDNYYRPNKSTKDGRAMRNRFYKMSMPPTLDMVRAFGAKDSRVFCSDMRIRAVGFEVMGAHYVVAVPKEAKGFKPAKGLKEIPLSKFFAMQEKKQAA